MKRETLPIRGDYIKLDALLKLAGVAGTGGQAKMLIEDGLVLVDGEVCLQRGRKIAPGMLVSFEGIELAVEAER